MRKVIYLLFLLCFASCSTTKNINTMDRMPIVEYHSWYDDIDTTNTKNNNKKEIKSNMVKYLSNKNDLYNNPILDKSITQIKINGKVLTILYVYNNESKLQSLIKDLNDLDETDNFGFVVYSKNPSLMCNNTFGLYDNVYLDENMQVISKGIENSKGGCSTKFSKIALYLPKGLMQSNYIEVGDVVNLPKVYNMVIYNHR